MLKPFIYLFLLLSLPLFSLGKATEQTHLLFEKGNQQYAKAQYQEAAVSYQKILTNGYQSAEVYFNLGNAFYKIDDIPSALLYYEKAHKLAPGDEDINVNIQVANLKITDKIEEAPEFFLLTWWKAFILLFSIQTLSILSILFFLSGSIILIIYLFTQSLTLKKTSFYTAVLLIFFGMISIFLTSRQSQYFAAHHQVIIFNNMVTVKSEPALSSKNLFVIHEGTKADIMERNTGWMKIKLSNGNVGWIILTDAREI